MDPEVFAWSFDIFWIAAILFGALFTIINNFKYLIDPLSCPEADGWCVDVFRSIIMIKALLLWIDIFPKYQNRTLDPVTLPTPFPFSYRRTYKRRRIRHYLTMTRLATNRRRRKVVKKYYEDFEEDSAGPYDHFQHRFLHNPYWNYGQDFDQFCAILNPLTAFQCSKMDFIQTTKVKNKTTASANIAAVSLYVPKEGEPSFGLSAETQRTYPIVLDSGASVSITPLASDFVTPIQPMPNSSVRGLSSSTRIAGIGYVEWTLRDVNGTIATIRTKAYHIPDAEVRLFSPQVYFQENSGGSYLINKDTTLLTLPNGKQLTFPFFLGNNLPMDVEPTPTGLSFEDLHEVASKLIAISVVDETNANLTSEKKELLGWHWKLGHIGFDWLRRLMRPRNVDNDPNDPKFLKPVILTNFAQTRSCPDPLCAACQIARMHRRGAGTSIESKRKEKLMKLRQGHLHPGQVVSLDQYE